MKKAIVRGIAESMIQSAIAAAIALIIVVVAGAPVTHWLATLAGGLK